VRGAEGLQAALQRAQVAVRDELHVRAGGLGQLGGGLHRVVHLVVEQQRVAAGDERGHRRHVAHGGRGRDDRGPAEQLGQAVLGDAVQGRAGVGAGGGELRAEPVDRVADRGLQPGIGLEAQVGAGAEVHQLAAQDGDVPAVERVVLDVVVQQTAPHPVRDHFVDCGQQLLGCGHGSVLLCSARADADARPHGDRTRVGPALIR
jgi:hypothetical protein